MSGRVIIKKVRKGPYGLTANSIYTYVLGDQELYTTTGALVHVHFCQLNMGQYGSGGVYLQAPYVACYAFMLPMFLVHMYRLLCSKTQMFCS